MTARPRATGGFTYLEVLLAAVVLAGTMTCMGFALANTDDMAERQRLQASARYLLEDGVAWLRMLPRVDGSGASGFGMEAGETALVDVDDVDDLNNLVEDAPTDRSGVAAGADWQRTWKVASANMLTPTADATAGSTPLLRVRIGVVHQGREITSATLLLSRTP